MVPTLDPALGCSRGCHELWYEHDGAWAGHANVTTAAAPSFRRDAATAEQRLSFFEAIVRLLGTLTAHRRLTVVLERLPEADRGTFELLQHVFTSPKPWGARTSSQAMQGSLFVAELRETLERECVERALEETEGNITRAARMLGMKRPRLSQLIKKYGLHKEKYS